MPITIDLPAELENKLQAQSEAQQTSIIQLIEDMLVKSLNIELTIEEIEERYANEWVVVEITEFDEYEEPIKGIVVAHHVDREAVVEPGRQLHLQKQDVQSYTFFAGTIVPEGVVVIV